MQPSYKSPEINEYLKTICGIDRNYILKNECSFCHKDATEFKDRLSEVEYTISGLCQECQDKTFDE